MKKLALGLLVVLLLIPVAAELGWRHGLGLARERGIDVGSTRWSWPRRCAELQGGPLRQGLLCWSPLHPLVVELEGAVVDAKVAREGGGAAAAAAGPGELPPVRVVVSGLSLYWGDRSLAAGLAGTLEAGSGRLEGDGVVLTLPGPTLEATRQSPLDELRGEVRVKATPERVELRAARLELVHPLVSRRPLPLEGLEIDLEGDVGELRLGGLRAELRREAEGAWTVEMPDQEAAEVLAVFSPIAPELRHAEVRGRIGASGRWSPEGWSLTPRIEGLGVEGAVSSIDALKYGIFDYRVRGADGETRVRTSGEGSVDWVPLREISPHLVAAVIAAEDSAFLEHGGYSLEGIQQAIDANREAGKVVRGGSTLTQQLAKNLFLDGERTLERKLRELILAVELDRRLGKDRVMELYLNIVEWGPDFWGVKAAADRYFLRRPSTIPPNEAAFLAAILPDPRGFYEDWYLRGRASKFQVGWILRNMQDGGRLEDADRWAREPIRFVPPPTAP